MRTGGANEDEEGDDLGDEGPSDDGGDEVNYDWGPNMGFGMDVSMYLSYT